jgi:hypothetical protein
MNTRTLVSLAVGIGSGLAASALALQATGAWAATETEVSAVIAVAAGCASIATIRGAMDRFRSSINWRRGGLLFLSFAIAIGSILSTTGWTLVASGLIASGKDGKTFLIALGAISAFIGAVSDAYSDDRVMREDEAEKRVESCLYGLIGTVLTEMEIDPQDLEAIIYVKTRRLMRPRSFALRVAYATSVGLTRPHPKSVINAPRPGRAEGTQIQAFRKTVWNAFKDRQDGEAPFANLPLRVPTSITIPFMGPIISQISKLFIPVYLWASPIKTSSDKAVGVVALQTFAAHRWRHEQEKDEAFLKNELQSCATALAQAMKADYK